MPTSILVDSNTGKAVLFKGYAIYVYDYLRFTSENANIVERCTYQTIKNGVTATATSSYGRASFYFPVTSGKSYTLSFDSECVDGYKMLYISNKLYSQGEGWSGTYTTMSIATNGHKTYTFTANSNVLWLGLYITANTSVGTITITNAELKEN